MDNLTINHLPIKINKIIIPLDYNYAESGDLLIKPGDRVKKYDALTKIIPGNHYSCAVHAPVSGVISSIAFFPTLQSLGSLNKLTKTLCIEISSEQTKLAELLTSDLKNLNNLTNFHNLSLDKLLDYLSAYGIVGLGGAGFPTAGKIQQNIQTIIINAMECESPISVDNSLMANYSDQIISGLNILNQTLKPKNIIIGIKKDYTVAIQELTQSLAYLKSQNSIDNISIAILAGGYPNGYSKSLIKLITKQELAAGRHSSDNGIICLNVATVYAIEQAINCNRPLVDRIVTITGDLIHTPGNYLLPIGTPINSLLKAFDINPNSDNLAIRIGGDYMGHELYNANNTTHLAHVDYLDFIAVDKTTQAISINSTHTKNTQPYSPCIKCGFCETACPMSLLPQQLYWYGQQLHQDNNAEILANHYLSSCIECGLCDTVCPSNIPLAAIFKNLKTAVNYTKHQKTQAQSAKVRHNLKVQREEDKLNKANQAKKVDMQSLLLSSLNLAKNKKLNKTNNA